MWPLLMIMLDVLRDGMMQGCPTEEDHPVQTFRFDRTDKPLGESVEIRTARWQGQRLDAGGAEDHIKSTGEFRIPVVQKVSAAGKRVAAGHGEISCCLPTRQPSTKTTGLAVDSRITSRKR